MHAMVGARGFALAASRASAGVYCGADGVFVGGVPLLRRAHAAGAWSVRPISELNDELSTLYRLPVDVTAKANALALIVHALNRGDLAMVAIATVQMQVPDPPLSKATESHQQIIRRAAELHRCGLLKWIWDPLEHPRLGGPPNAGWFASTGGAAQQSPALQAPPRPELAVLPNDPVIPLCLASTGGLGDCVGGQGGIGGEGRGSDSDFIESRGSSESGDYGRTFQLNLPLTEEPSEPASTAEPEYLPRQAPPRARVPTGAQQQLPFEGGLPRQRTPNPYAGESAETGDDGITARGGRLGNAATRAQNAEIAAELKKRGYEITNGGGVAREEYIRGDGPGSQGGTFVDITAVNETTHERIRVQTVDTLADGVTPTPRERDAAARIRRRSQMTSLF